MGTVIGGDIFSPDFNLFTINLDGGLSLQPRQFFNEIPTGGMFEVDELGDYVPALDPSSITDDPYFEFDGTDIIIKTLI